MNRAKRQLVTHTFKGKRFEDQGLDLDVLPELYAYKELLVSAAKELWRRHHPDRQRLPRHFEDSLCLRFYELQGGSVAIPIFREVEVATQAELFEFEKPDELDEAVGLIGEAVDASNAGLPLPETMPKNVIPLFESYGRTLREGESFELQQFQSTKKASYTPRTRERLLLFCAEGYTDRIDFTGEVRSVDLAGKFELRLPDGTKVPSKFDLEQEGLVTEALREHTSRRLRVVGTAEFHPDGRIKGITRVSNLTIQAANAEPFDASARPVWEIVTEIGAAAPESAWENVPRDLAKNLSHYLYGVAKE